MQITGSEYLGDLVGNDSGLGLDDRHNVANNLFGLGAGVLGGITRLRLLAVALLREHNQVCLVLGKARNVLAEGALRAVLAAEIHCDTDRAGLTAVHLCLLKLLKGESLASTLLHVVADGLAVHNGAQETVHRAGEVLDRLGKTVFPAPVFARRLVVPGNNATSVGRTVMPVLVEMRIGDLELEVGHDEKPVHKRTDKDKDQKNTTERTKRP